MWAAPSDRREITLSASKTLHGRMCAMTQKNTQIFTHTHTQINLSVGQGRQSHLKLWGAGVYWESHSALDLFAGSLECPYIAPGEAESLILKGV